MATKKFSPAQIAAQKLFAERARAGTLGKGKRKANPVKGEKTFKTGDYVKTDRGEIGRVSFYKDQPKGYANVYRLIDVEANDPYASTFLENGNFINGTRLKAYKQRKPNPDKDEPNKYVKRASQITGKAPSSRLLKRRTKALFAPEGYFPNPKAAMMTGYQVICMHPKKHVVGIFKTMAEAKLVARAMADAKGVAYAVKTVKVHKAHFAV